MRKARYFIRTTIDRENKTVVRDGSARYATLREAREALKRLTIAYGTDLKFRFSIDKKTLRRHYESDDTYFIHSILPIKLLQK